LLLSRIASRSLTPVFCPYTTLFRSHACGVNGYRTFIRDPYHQVVRCPNCGLYYVNPVPTAAELSRRVQESAAYTEDQLRKKEFFWRRAERLLNHIESFMPPCRLLDVGCSIGTELRVAQ